MNQLPRKSKLEPPFDAQQNILYQAEEVLELYDYELPEIDQMASFLSSVLNHPAIKLRYSQWAKVAITVKFDDDDEESAHAGYTDASFPPWSRRAYIVLHEAAHVLAQRIYGRPTIAAHGPEFAAIYVDLVEAALGREACNALLFSFHDHGVLHSHKNFPNYEPDIIRDFKVRVE